MTLPEGGGSALKWPTARARRKVCAEFCAHIAAGYSIDSFPDADRRTIRYYAEQFPEDFPPAKLEEAARRGGPEDSQTLETLKPRSSEEIALGVMALLTGKDMPKDGDGPRNAD